MILIKRNKDLKNVFNEEKYVRKKKHKDIKNRRDMRIIENELATRNEDKMLLSFYTVDQPLYKHKDY